MLWPVPNLLSYLEDLRTVRARERLEELHLGLAAARYTPDGVDATARHLEEAAGVDPLASMGTIDDLAADMAGA